jgi:RNA polymerase sigma-70 factor, ECF subfamily
VRWKQEPDRAGFAAAMLPHLDAGYNLARWLVRDASLAEDVMQEAMLRALTYFGGFRGENPRAWLLQIVRTTAWTTLAERRGAPIPVDDEAMAEIPDTADNPEQAFAAGERSARLDEALATLPLELRECLVLRELEELSYKEIARVTGVPIGTVMSRLWRARQALMGVAAEQPT